jgi:hypothetical protein
MILISIQKKSTYARENVILLYMLLRRKSEKWLSLRRSDDRNSGKFLRQKEK